jgi:MFS family permease
MSSFSIFSLFAFAPVFIQGGLGKSPMQVAIAMLSLSLGWSAGSLILGQAANRMGIKEAAVTGAILLIAGCFLTVLFSVRTTLATCFWVFMLTGLGMGFVTLATLVIVQNSVDVSDLGVATSSNQFARTLGGTVGVGICGSFMNAGLWRAIHVLDEQGLIPAGEGTVLKGNSLDYFLQPEFQQQLSERARTAFQAAIADSVSIVFWIVLVAAVVCLVFCTLLQGDADARPG